MTTPDLVLFRAHPDPMWIRDSRAERILAVNEAALVRYGYSEEEFLSLTPAALEVSPEEGDYPEWARSSAATGALHRLAGGVLLPVAVDERPVRYARQDAVLVVARDVTPWVALERDNRQLRQDIARAGQELAGARERLRQSEERFRTVVDATADVVWDWSVDDGAVWRSNRLHGLPGGSSGPDRDGIDSWRRRLHPEDADRVTAQLQAMLVSGDDRWDSLYRLRREDGSWAQIRDRGSVIRDDSGRAVRMVGTMLDVTEQRELAEKLQRSQRLDAVGQLTGGVAHDFNNLLTVILGNADMLASTLTGNPRLEPLAQMIRSAAERGAELTRRLLAFARRQALDPSPTDVDDLLRSMYELLSRTLGGHVEIELVPGEDVWKAMVDPSQLESAVLNLCLNARDAMPSGGRLTVTTGNVTLTDGAHIHQGDVEPGDYVVITVSDTGVGMAPDIVRHAFEPFFTTKDTGKGSGLGLSMVYGFVKQSAGHVRIDSTPGAGTAVTLYLPRAVASSSAAVPGPEGGAVVGGSERILVVEDEDIVRAFVEDQLRELGYSVIAVPNAREALRVLQAERVDLLFTDVVMPGGMDGRQLADAALALRPGLPVLFTSGYTDSGVVHGGRLDSGVQLLQKPYRRAELAARVRRALGGSDD